MKPTMLEALEAGYLLALQMPHDMLRIRNQETLCKLRDAIAEASGLDPQAVQESFEELALKIQLADKLMADLAA